jgi:phosphoglycolate phosphatase
MKYKLVIFDFDGTLADSYPWFLTVFEDLAKRYKLPRLEQADFENLRTLEVHQILKDYHIPLWKMVIIGNHLKKLMSRQIGSISLVNGMEAVIEQLGITGVKLAVVTSNAEANVRQVLGARSLPYFDTIESGVSLFGKKARFQKILKKTGILASQALSIGDEVRDLKSSRAAKIPFGAVNWGYTDLTILQKHSPEEVFTQPDQILEATI